MIESVHCTVRLKELVHYPSKGIVCWLLQYQIFFPMPTSILQPGNVIYLFSQVSFQLRVVCNPSLPNGTKANVCRNFLGKESLVTNEVDAAPSFSFLP